MDVICVSPQLLAALAMIREGLPTVLARLQDVLAGREGDVVFLYCQNLLAGRAPGRMDGQPLAAPADQEQGKVAGD